MQTTKRLIAAGLLAVAAMLTPATVALTDGASGPEIRLASAPSAYAEPKDGPKTTGPRTKKQLEDAGYACEYQAISGGMYECTKQGDNTYWCSSKDSCDVKPLRRVPTTYTRPAGSGTYTTAP